MRILLVALNSKFIHTNIAIRYIKSYASEFDITLKEYTINDSIINIMEDINGFGADIIGFSCYIWNIDMVLKLGANLKKISPNLTIILGGPEVSYDSPNIMRENPFIDYIIKGEGEISSKQLFDYLINKHGSRKDIGGLVYRSGEDIMENGGIQLVEDLNSIPFPYEENELDNKIAYYESSRGCPYKCAYCLSSTINGVRFLPLDRVKNDLYWFIERNIKIVKFVDRTFNCGNQFLDIMKFLVENRKNTRFHFELSADILNEATMKFLSKVPKGLFQFEIGVQSTNEETLRFVDRRMSFKKLSHNVRRLREWDNIELHLDLIAGLPGEDYTSFGNSFDDVFALRPHVLQLGFLKLLKGSKLRENAGYYGISYSDYPPYEILKSSVLPFDDISKLKNIEEVVDNYYNSGRFKLSIRYVTGLYNSPFQAFESLSHFRNLKYGKNKNIGNVEQYKMLYDFCISIIGDDKIIKELLSFDYLMQGRNPVVPYFLCSNSEIDKQFLWDFLSDEHNIKEYFPCYIGKSTKEILKNIYARNFTVDIDRYINYGEIIFRDACLVFDYGRKNSIGDITYISI